MCLEKVFGIVEMLDWAMAFFVFYIDYFDKSIVEFIFGIVFKDWQDICYVQDFLLELFEKVGVILKLEDL